MDGRKGRRGPQWIDLPRDVTANILQRLGAIEILESAQYVCTTWWRLSFDPAMWRVIHMRLTRWRTPYTCHRAVITCRRAVDLSQGQLLDLSIQFFGDDYLLNYIAHRSSNLKRLTLYCCNIHYNRRDCCLISGKCVSEATRRFRHLEELHLIVSELFLASDIETIAISCPKLKSFTFMQDYCKWIIFVPNPNEFTLAIAKNMPNLCHLRLLSQWMTNEGLEAILDGCPKLQSLDLRRCSYLDLRGALGRRCYQHIKHFRGPNDD